MPGRFCWGLDVLTVVGGMWISDPPRLWGGSCTTKHCRSLAG